VGTTVTKIFPLSQILEIEQCISEASSGKTAHLKMVPKEKICVSVVYITDTNLILDKFVTAIGLSPSGSSTVHIYTQTIHRTTKKKKKQTIHRTTQK
jgi:hypothetical protein